MAGPWDRVTKGRHTLYRRDWALIADAGISAGVQLRVMQGSWSGSVKASAGTHSGGGAVDISVAGMTERRALALVAELRKRNGAAWLRSPKYGWPARLGGAHIHCIIRDSPGLSRGAKAQVAAFNRGRNGLASQGRDPFARPAHRVWLLPGQRPSVVVPAVVKGVLDQLRYGGRGAEVRALQRALRIAVDGRYGPQTDAAVRKHQRKLFGACDPRHKSFVGPRQASALGLIVLPKEV